MNYNSLVGMVRHLNLSSVLRLAAHWVLILALIVFFSIQLAVSISTNGRLAEALQAQEKATREFVESNSRVTQESRPFLATLEAFARELVAIQNESPTAKRIVRDLGISIKERSDAPLVDRPNSETTQPSISRPR